MNLFSVSNSFEEFVTETESSLMNIQMLNNEECQECAVLQDPSWLLWITGNPDGVVSNSNYVPSISDAFEEISKQIDYDMEVEFDHLNLDDLPIDLDANFYNSPLIGNNNNFNGNNFNGNNNYNGNAENQQAEAEQEQKQNERRESITGKTIFDETLLNLHTHIGSMDMQQLLSESGPSQIEVLIRRVIFFHSRGALDLAKLSCDIYGNFVIQKLFEKASPESRKALFLSMVPGNSWRLCSSSYGCWVMQTVIDSVDSECIRILLSEIEEEYPPIADKINHPHYNHVLQKLIEYGMVFSDIRFIANCIQSKLAFFCERQFGCRVAQALINNYPSQIDLSCIVHDDNVNVCELSSMKYGNFVIGCMLDNAEKISKSNKKIIGIICRDVLLNPENLLFLSCNKFGSNVVEKCINVCKREQKNQVVRMLTCFKNEYVLKSIANHKFGNYVVQTLMNRCNNKQQKDRIFQSIQPLVRNNINTSPSKSIAQSPKYSPKYQYKHNNNNNNNQYRNKNHHRNGKGYVKHITKTSNYHRNQVHHSNNRMNRYVFA